MYVFVPAAVVFIAVFLLFTSAYGLLRGKRDRIARQLKNIKKTALEQEVSEENLVKQRPEKGTASLKGRKHSQKVALLDKYYESTAKKLQKAYLLYRPREFMLVSLAVSLVFIFLTVFIIGARIPMVTRNPAGLLLMVLVSGAVGFMLPNVYLTFREQQFKRRLNSQLGDMLLLLSNYIRAGHSVTRAIEMTGREVPSPLSDELKKFIKDVNLGGTLPEALIALDKRTNDEDMGLIITAILINHQVGGNLAEVLDSIHHTIQERIRIKGEIQTLTAEGRLSGLVIGLLPVVMGFVIFMLNPEFVSLLFTEPLGRIMLAAAVLMEIAGAVVIRRIVQIEV